MRSSCSQIENCTDRRGVTGWCGLQVRGIEVEGLQGDPYDLRDAPGDPYDSRDAAALSLQVSL